MLETLGALGFVGALVVAPLAWREWRDRREAQGLRLQADVREAVNRRLEGESLVSVRVRPGALWRPGRVELSTPSGWEWLVEQVWLPVVARIPPDYELVVRPARPRVPARAADPEWRRAA
jgi:hypothetical protein